MVTSIVQSVQNILQETWSKSVEAEIIFPVSSDAIMINEDQSESSNELPIVPGVSGGEGCSTAGGCATCPFMKMNDIDRVHDILEMMQSSSSGSKPVRLQGHLPPDRLKGRSINGQDATDLGSEAILYMRQFMKDSALPAELVQKITSGDSTS